MSSENVNDAFDKKKGHRDRNSGRKAEKKKQKVASQHVQELTDKQRNPKAFAINSAVRAERRFRRRQDIDTKKQHIPIIDRTPIEPPPILVAVVGPPKVGKTTLISNLIKSFTKSPLTNMQGPVTLISGKKRRITFIECNNDINCMLDIAKIADLVLLLCDASFGFEMEIFEFLNICQVHGMPRIMGVLTHLDMLKNTKTLKRTKKMLKHRFWTEVYAGAKLFYLSGIVHGEYLRNEITNLGRFISIMKFRPITWRNTHSYILADRYEDLTNGEIIRQNRKADRKISLYGYVRGIPLHKESSIHLAGVGDFKVHDVSFLPDPCPLPDVLKKRSLLEKERLIYAPFSGVGGIVYDKDAVYVDLGGSHSHQVEEANDETNSKSLVSTLIDSKQTLDSKIEESEMQIFTDSKKIKSKDVHLEDDQMEVEFGTDDGVNRKSSNCDLIEDELESELRDFSRLSEEVIVDESGRKRRKVIFPDEDQVDETSSEEENDELDESSDEEHTLKTNPDDYKALRTNKDQEVLSKIKDNLKLLESSDNKFVQESSSSNDELSADEADKMSEGESDDEDLDDEESLSGDDEGISVKWKDNLAQKAQDAFVDRQNRASNLMKLIYGVFDNKPKRKQEGDVEEKMDEDEDEFDTGGLLKSISASHKKKQDEKDTMNLQETSLFIPWDTSTRDWLSNENKSLIKDCFVTGKWKESEDAAELLRLDDLQDSDVSGDFEDLETGEKHVTKASNKSKPDDDIQMDEEKPKESGESLAEKKKRLKEKFDADYDNGGEKNSYFDELKASAEKQAQLNKSVFEDMADDVRVQLEGFRAGMYVRLELQNVPCEFVENFDATYPLVIGALNMGEEKIGFVNVKIKKHRWFSRTLKTRDPVIISMGWRRFQTLPLYSKLEDDLKFRYLKYTPDHVTCNAHFWGPITPQGTGFLAIQNCTADIQALKQQGFRIAATGVVQELDKSTQVMKKLKLIGEPLKIYKKTAFIKGMFNTALEVAKFEGARIKSVSGIRGMIKKAVNKPQGCFRATFEDKILLSDIVFLRAWYKVDVPQFYNPITNLLLPQENKNSWSGMKTTGQLKREQGIKSEVNTDHLYTEIKREAKVFKPLVVPRALQKALPYRDKQKLAAKVEKKYKRVAVIREPHERKVSDLMRRLRTTFDAKQEKLKAQTAERMKAHIAELKTAENILKEKQKKAQREACRIKSKAQLAQEKKEAKRGNKRKSK